MIKTVKILSLFCGFILWETSLACAKDVTMPCTSNAPNIKVANQNVNHVYADSCSAPNKTNGKLDLQGATVEDGISGTPANFPNPSPSPPSGPFNIEEINIDKDSKIMGDTGKPGIELNEVAGEKDRIKEINNNGIIEGDVGNPDIKNNNGEIEEINNRQGGDRDPLSYEGKTPESYNQIIEKDGYGQIEIEHGSTGEMSYGVTDSSGDPGNARPGTYSDVVVNNDENVSIKNKSGDFGDRGHYELSCSSTGAGLTYQEKCDQKVFGLYTDFIGFNNPNVPNTYAAIASNKNALTGLMHQRYAVLNAVMQYDCKKFDKYGFCLSFQVRGTGFGSQASGAGVINASFRVSEQIRVGAYLDYQFGAGSPQNSTYTYLDSVRAGYDNPTFGGYFGYSGGGYGSNPGYTGLQLKVSGGYNPGKVSISRGLLYATEPAVGTAGLNSYYIYGSSGWGFALGETHVIEPYIGLGFTNVTRESYAEGFNLATTLFPLTYNSFYEKLLTGYVGANLRGMIMQDLGYQIGMAGQFDLQRTANGYTGWSTIPGMVVFGIDHGGSWNGARPVGNAGIFYDIGKNQRIMLNGYTGQQAFTTRGYLTGLLAYQVSF